MKKTLSLFLCVMFVFLFTACSEMKYANQNEFKYENTIEEDFINKNGIDTTETETENENKEDTPKHILRTTGVWYNQENENEKIEMTDNMYFGYFPDTTKNEFFFYGTMDIKNGQEAIDELHIEESEIIAELTKEDYYSIIVTMDEYAMEGYSMAEGLTEDSKVWYMIIFFSDDFICVYDANNDTVKNYIRET